MEGTDSQQTELNITYGRAGDYLVIELDGEVDVYSANSLRGAIVEKVEEGEYRIAIDLNKVAFLDSTGLGVLVGGLKRVRSHQGELGIICNQDKILRIFRITGLEKIFPIYDGVEGLARSRAGD
jgi:anti-sigma B factor antagonist